MAVAQAFGKLVRLERRARKISQEELAERAGLHRNAIGLIERAERSPSIESVFAIARGLGLTASQLLAKLEEADPEASQSGDARID